MTIDTQEIPQYSHLPPPDLASWQLSCALKSQLIDLIAQHAAPISFATFMDRLLYTPQLGYYQNAGYKFGQRGDFTTAPELSPLFGYAVAQACLPLLNALPQFDMLEFGAGSGQLCVDMLNALHAAGHQPTHYYIVETSAELRQRQQDKLRQHPELYSCVTWLTQLPTSPINGIVIANEVLDAMPVHRVSADVEWGVGLHDNNAFCWQSMPFSCAKLEKTVTRLNLPPDMISEVNLSIKPWLRSIAHCLARGSVILIDYGFPRHEFYHPTRIDGTLMCHYQHRAHADSFCYPGLQDITAHVDFTAVAEAAVACGLSVCGFTTQGLFLLANGITTQLDADSDLASKQALRVLTEPQEMGELFKVIALSKDMPSPRGFELRDMRARL